jgi:hypothetical protein
MRCHTKHTLPPCAIVSSSSGNQTESRIDEVVVGVGRTMMVMTTHDRGLTVVVASVRDRRDRLGLGEMVLLK